MRFTRVVSALLGLASLTAAAPAIGHDVEPRSEEKRSVALVQNIQASITVVQSNVGLVNSLADLAEKQFAQLLQAKFALAATVSSIKNNIRLNHFKSRFAQVNTVLVTVTSVVDIRDPLNLQNRYLVEQLLADNGFADKILTVMVSDIETMTISSDPEAETESATSTSSDLEERSLPTDFPLFVPYDPEKPYGSINESLLLQIGAAAPNVDLVFPDPAAIIFAGQHNLFVETVDNFAQTCGFFVNSGNSFLNFASGLISSLNVFTVTRFPFIPVGGLLDLPILGTATETDFFTSTSYTKSFTETASSTESDAESTTSEEVAEATE